MSALPDSNDVYEINEYFKFLITRSIVKFLPAFKTNFEKIIAKHLTHPFQEEMSKKSDVVIFYIIYKFRYIAPKIGNDLEHIYYIYLSYHYIIPLLFQVPLGLLFKSENVNSEVNQIFQHIQKEYVPTFIKDDGETEVLLWS